VELKFLLLLSRAKSIVVDLNKSKNGGEIIIYCVFF
jgi:hypothetical protein